MERKHPIEHKRLASQAAKDKMESSSDQPTIEVIVERLKPLSKDSERHVKLVEAIGNFIAVDMQPLVLSSREQGVFGIDEGSRASISSTF